MDNRRVDVTRNRTILLIVGAIAFVAVIIAISIVAITLSSDDSGVKIANEDNVTDAEDSSIESHDYSLIKKQLRTLLTDSYALPENEEIKALIRESTYAESGEDGEKIITFTLDVESVKTTFYVWMSQTSEDASEVSISCAPTNDSKYPETFCIGTEGYSSIDANMSADLPYRYKENGELKFEITHEEYDPRLILSVQASCDDDAAVETAKNKAKEWIKSYGLDPEQVPIEENKSSCKAYEDQLKESQRGKHTQENMNN